MGRRYQLRLPDSCTRRTGAPSMSPEAGQSTVEFALILTFISVPLFMLTWELLRWFVWVMVQQVVANFTGVPPP